MSELNPISRKVRRWERRKKARPQELLTAALDLFAERGFAATRMEDVAKRAGVAKGTLYLYFSNKDELFKAAVRENTLPILGDIEAVIDNFEGDSVNLFREIVLRWWEQIGGFRPSDISKLLLAEAYNLPDLAKFYHDEVILRSNEIVRRVLCRGVKRGEFRKPDPYLTEVIVAPLIMLLISKHSFRNNQMAPISSKVYLNNFIELCIHGILRSPASIATNPDVPA